MGPRHLAPFARNFCQSKKFAQQKEPMYIYVYMRIVYNVMQ